MLAHPLTRAILSPILLAQAVGVRRRARRLPEPDGPRRGTGGQGPALRLLIVGDSSAAGVGVRHQDQALAGQLALALARDFTVDWQLEAWSGATTGAALDHLRGLQPARFDVAVSVLGVNDVVRQTSLRRWAAGQAELSRLLVERFSVRFQWRCGVPPLNLFPLLKDPLAAVLGAQAAQFDAVLAAGATDRIRHLPFDETRLTPAMMAEDGYHPGEALYRDWALLLADEIRAASTGGTGLPDSGNPAT